MGASMSRSLRHVDQDRTIEWMQLPNPLAHYRVTSYSKNAIESPPSNEAATAMMISDHVFANGFERRFSEQRRCEHEQQQRRGVYLDAVRHDLYGWFRYLSLSQSNACRRARKAGGR